LKKNKSIVVINRHLLGVYSVRGVSFTVKNQERMVLLCANSSGASSLILSVLGLKMVLDGKIVINGDLKISKHYNECSKLHGIVGYQP
jgi:ABC-type branched-subunit amino acid transport system ATPase component